MDPFAPTPADRFTFGLWTLANVGRDPFGEPTRAPIEPTTIVAKLAELGAYGVNFHDHDLVPDGTPAAERDGIVARFRSALDTHGLVVPMATTNLFTDPVFKDGAFTSADARVRHYALQKTMRAMDLGVELGARTFVCWGGREGAEVDAGGKLLDALAWYREALDYLCDYAVDQGYDLRFALEPKPNEPRGHAFLPTVGSALGFITTLNRPEMVGVNPELAHETMAGLSFPHALAAALDAGKLFHVDLNDQVMSRFDQDLRFGAENLKTAFFTVALLEGHGYDGPRHFDAHALRTEDEAGVWAFAAGCMRTYKLLAAKVARFEADPDVRAAREAYRVDDPEGAWPPRYSAEHAAKLRSRAFDLDALRRRGPGLEHLDQLTVEILLGAR